MKFGDLRGILQYVPQFRGQLFVVAIDGAVAASENFANVLLDLAVLHSLNVKLAIVHGAGAQIRALAHVEMTDAPVPVLVETPADEDALAIADATALRDVGPVCPLGRCLREPGHRGQCDARVPAMDDIANGGAP